MMELFAKQGVSVPITTAMVWEAYRHVKGGGEAAELWFRLEQEPVEAHVLGATSGAQPRGPAADDEDVVGGHECIR